MFPFVFTIEHVLILSYNKELLKIKNVYSSRSQLCSTGLNNGFCTMGNMQSQFMSFHEIIKH